MPSYLRTKRKAELTEMAQHVGVSCEGLKKTEIEARLDGVLVADEQRWSRDPMFLNYYQSRGHGHTSPFKRESSAYSAETRGGSSLRRFPQVPDEDDVSAVDDSDEAETVVEPSRPSNMMAARTPARALSLAQRIPLPASPADVAQAVDRSAVAMRQRVKSLYKGSGIAEKTQHARELLSTVNTILLLSTVFEMYHLKQEVLPNRYAFTIPAVRILHTPNYPVFLPDLFLVLTTNFWGPTITWAVTSFLIPVLTGYFFNLSAAHSVAAPEIVGPRTRSRPRSAGTSTGQPDDYVVDPLAYSVAKAVAGYVVYAQKATFLGLFNVQSIRRVEGALYSGWAGILASSAITGIAAIYDAALRK